MGTLWRTRAGRPELLAVGLLAAGAIVGSAIVTLAGDLMTRWPAAPAVPVTYAQGPGQAPVSFQNGFVSSVSRAAPAVVNVFSERVVRVTEQQQPNLPPFFNEPFFRRFFGDGMGQAPPRNYIERSLGSGVIVSADGYILTNSHVVESAREVRVGMATGRELDVKIVGVDPLTDVAVLKADASGLPVIPVGDSSKVQVGDFALAIGNPYGVGQTVTQGIISATQRTPGIATFESFLQTDAAINRGNSGGALTNYAGDLIGLNTAIVSPTGGFEGIGFAVPVNMAMAVMKEIIQSGRVIRGYLGVTIQEVTPSLAKAFGLPQAEGALISDIAPNSPAARAGLERGDVIVAVNGKRVQSPQELQRLVAGLQPGAAANLTIMRNGQEQTVSARVTEMPEEVSTPPTTAPEPQGTALEGVTVTNLTPGIANELDLPPNTTGVVVTNVTRGTPAAFAGLERGMIIRQVNRQPVNSVSEFAALVRRAGNQPILLLVQQDGSNRYIVVPPPGQEQLP